LYTYEIKPAFVFCHVQPVLFVATKIVANAATSQCWRSIVSSNNKRNDTVEDNKNDNVIVDMKEKKDNGIIYDVKGKKWLTTRTISPHEHKKVEGPKIVGNAATKQCQRSIVSSNNKRNDKVEDMVEDKIEDNVVDDVVNKKEDDVVSDVKERYWKNTLELFSVQKHSSS